MSSTNKHFILLLFYAFTIHVIGASSAELPEDRGYEVLKFKVPHTVWKQALRPTPPVLKSPVTITLPVNVQQDEVEDDTEDVETDVDDSVVSNDQVETPALDPVVSVQNPDVPSVQNPIQPSEQDPPVNTLPEIQQGVVEDVPGQVIRFPCACVEGQCGCCTGTILERIKMKACGNMTFVPEDFIFDVRLTVNNNTVVRRRVSARDPPPICFNPRRAPFVRVCAEISNISVKNRNARACLDINADIGGFQIYSASFRCFSFGTSGLQTGLKPKPPSSGPKPVSLYGNGAQEENSIINTAAETVLNGGNGIFGGQGPLGGGLFGGNGGGLFGGGNGGGIFGGNGGGLFGGDGGGIFGGGGNNGPLEGIGEAIGDFL